MIQIQFNQADLTRWMSALRRVKRRVHGRIKEQMQMDCAIEYYQKVVGNIMTQKFAGKYAHYHPKYAAWKAQYAATTGFWVLGGDLVKNMQIFRREGGWVGGIPGGIMDTGGKSWLGPRGKFGKPKQIAMYGKVMEFGKGPGPGGVHPARAVFEPTMEEYAKDGWEKKGQEALNKVGEAWS